MIRHILTSAIVLLAVCAAPTGCSEKRDTASGGRTKPASPRSGAGVLSGSTRGPRDEVSAFKALMPLAVGNTWTYQWESPLTNGDDETETKEPNSYGQLHYASGSRSVTATTFRRRIRRHRETYRITQRQGDQYRFEVVALPVVPASQLRDGRYEEAERMSWVWWQKGGIGLCETILRTPGIHANYLKVERDDTVVDERNLLQMNFHRGQWHRDFFTAIHSASGDDTGVTIVKFASAPAEVQVPAGTFPECTEVVAKGYNVRGARGFRVKDLATYFDQEKQSLVWETHTLWAPAVGLVREYQKLKDGTLGYDLRLLHYDVRLDVPKASESSPLTPGTPRKSGTGRSSEESPRTLVYRKSDGGEYYVQERKNSNRGGIGAIPESLLPLRVGNSWEYTWESHVDSRAKAAEVGCVRVFASAEKKRQGRTIDFATVSLAPHVVTFTVVNRRDSAYSVEIQSGDHELARDGRYRHAHDVSWSWWKGTGGEIGLSETIHRKWTDDVRRALLSPSEEAPGVLPIDNQNVLHFKPREGDWRAVSWSKWETGDFRVISYETAGTAVQVPAGTFPNCVRVVVGVYEKPFERVVNDSRCLWTTYTFWAPSVGMVREYQKAADGTTTYELKLVRFTLK